MTDPQFFDGPPTLITAVPDGWLRCQVIQGKSQTVVACANGAIEYEVLPNADPIIIQSVPAK